MDALYRRDDRGRIVSINEWNGPTAPRFALMRTTAGAICRFRYDVPDDIARAIEEICNQEPCDEPIERLPRFQPRYIELLSQHMPVTSVGAGPAFMFTKDVQSSVAPVPIDENNAELLRGGLDEWVPDVPYRRPFMVIVADGHAVSVCASVRISDAVHCAGVETVSAYRRKDYAVSVVAGWARAVKAMGATPFYSTSWDNVASQNVANRLGLKLAGVDFQLS